MEGSGDITMSSNYVPDIDWYYVFIPGLVLFAFVGFFFIKCLSNTCSESIEVKKQREGKVDVQTVAVGKHLI